MIAAGAAGRFTDRRRHAGGGPGARIGHIGLYRDPKTQVVVILSKMPGDLGETRRRRPPTCWPPAIRRSQPSTASSTPQIDQVRVSGRQPRGLKISRGPPRRHHLHRRGRPRTRRRRLHPPRHRRRRRPVSAPFDKSGAPSPRPFVTRSAPSSRDGSSGDQEAPSLHCHPQTRTTQPTIVRGPAKARSQPSTRPTISIPGPKRRDQLSRSETQATRPTISIRDLKRRDQSS